MSEKARSLPDFLNPPVVETLLSVQFVPIPNLSIPHFGLYWSHIRSEFPSFQVQPPLSNVTEDFGPDSTSPSIGLQVLTEPVVRCWFLDQAGNRIIQIQNDRFIYNWRKVTGEEQYPRYESVRDKFEIEWVRFCEFLKRERFNSPEVNQCEVTYVNHLEYEKGWKTYGELNRVIASWSGRRSGSFLPEPEKVSINVRYALPEKLGRLHVTAVPVFRRMKAEELLQLNVTARGAPASSKTEDICKWLDMGRKWVVEGFTDFTTSAMHKIWRRTL